MDPKRDILLGGIIPGFISLIILLIAWQPWRKVPIQHGNWGGAIAIAVSFVVGFYLTMGKIDFPPSDATQWIVVGAIGLGLIGVGLNLFKSNWMVELIVMLLAIAGLMTLILLRQIQNRWTGSESFYWIASLTITTTAWTFSTEQLAKKSRDFIFPLALTLIFIASSALMLMSNSQKLGQLGGILSAGIGAFVIATIWSPTVSLSRGAILVAFPCLAACMVRGYLSPGLSPLNIALILMSPPLLWITQLPILRSMKTWQRLILSLILISIPLTNALVPTTQKFLQDMKEELGY